MDGSHGSDRCDGCGAANASADALPRQGPSPWGRALPSATEKRPASHPNTLHL